MNHRPANITANYLPLWLDMFPETVAASDRWLVSTHSLYPNGQNVTAEVTRQASGLWSVADAGQGRDLLSEMLMEPSTQRAGKRAAGISERTGVTFNVDRWSLFNIEDDAVAGAIMWVAFASQAWVSQLLTDPHAPSAEAIERNLVDKLLFAFGQNNVATSGKILGESSRSYEFAAIVNVPGGKTAAFEVVTPFGASVNAAFTKLTDVRAREGAPDYLEAVIHNSAAWSSSDLALLGSSATSVIDISYGFEARLAKIAA